MDSFSGTLPPLGLSVGHTGQLKEPEGGLDGSGIGKKADPGKLGKGSAALLKEYLCVKEGRLLLDTRSEIENSTVFR